MIERKDIDPERTWIISDTHFGHNNIIRFCNRPENHDEIMMEAWANVPTENSTLIHLGDLTYRGEDLFQDFIAPQLSGGERKLLILGNHDHQKPSYYEQAGFEIIEPFAFYYGPRATRVTFSHYPWEDHEGPLTGVHIHGHIHNNGYSGDRLVPFVKNQINVSVEITNYRPVNLDALLRGYINGTYK